MPRGRLIVVEGPDGAGKTTLALLLASHLGAEYIKLPDRSTPTGKLIDSFLKKELEFSKDAYENERIAQLVFAANNAEKRSFIVDLLNRGRDVVLDRYLDSACVYFSQATRTLGHDLILSFSDGMPAPDLVCVLELPWDIAETRRAHRGDAKRERNDFKEVHEAVAHGFRDMWRHVSWPRVFMDAQKPVDDILKEALGHVHVVPSGRGLMVSSNVNVRLLDF